ncbi:hypothetical protein SAMN05660742_10693 [Propionispira arboris]|uniref:Uncharacterized protein n=2 Tax=Propionispira arboris TaxID=84035 RepID=A0A1H6Y367_9FIRM|nr:hypothetical protein SAMN05660742_10693 [Propionispira arboris]
MIRAALLYGCDKMLKVLVGVLISLIGLLIFENFIKNNWNYNDLDAFVKFLTCFGGIVTAWGVYWKWNDEKGRKFYEERIQKVYAPLTSVYIFQETYRGILQDVESVDISRENHPIFGDSKYQTHYKRNADGKTVFYETRENEEKKYMSRKIFLATCESTYLGLARPMLLTLISKYKFLLPYKEEHWEILLKNYPDIYSKVKTKYRETQIFNSKIYMECRGIDDELKKVERQLCEEIISGYNDSLEKLGLDKQKIDITQSDFIQSSD